MNVLYKNSKNFILSLKLVSFIIILLFYLMKSLPSFDINNKINNFIIKKISTLVSDRLRNNEEKEDSSFESQVEKVCKKASENLQNYYKTYDISSMDVSSMSFKDVEIYPDYIESLFNIMENNDELKKNILNYLSHAFPAFLFGILGILSVFAWLFFSFYCCCNCCCCCCCKKPECKCSCLFVPLIFDLIIIGACLFGIFNASKMFTGLGDVECSLMKFISEINSGENKSDKSRWRGFDEILKTFDEIKSKIDRVQTQTKEQLDQYYTDLSDKKTQFPETLTQTYKDLVDPNDPSSPIIFDPRYTVQFIREDTTSTLDIGALDILYNYGPINKDEKFLFLLNEQYKKMTQKADIYLDKAHASFDNILSENSVGNLIESSRESVKELSISINDIKDKIAKYVIDYSDLIESYGSYIIKIIYIVIASLAGFSMVVLIMMYLFTEEYCYGKCCCGKGLAKTLNHISWNLMSLVMICSFLICGVVFLLTYLGKDLVQVITIIVSKKNLYSKNPILITGDVKDYLNVCFHGDGDLASVLGLTNENSSTFEFDELNGIMGDINEIKQDIYVDDVVIKSYKEELEKRKNLHDINIYDFNDTNTVNLDKLIYNFNELIKNEEYDEWTLNDTCPDESYTFIHCPVNSNNNNDGGDGSGGGSGDGSGDGSGGDTGDGSGGDAGDGGTNENTVTRKNIEDRPIPKECLNFEEWSTEFEKRYSSPPLIIIHITYATVLKAAKYYVNAVNNITKYIKEGPTITALEEKVGIVEEAYNDVIQTEKETLELYNKTIYDVTSVFNEINSGTGSLFSFLNCKFIGNNALIILKNLDNAFGGSVQNIAITFMVASFGMFFSIVFIILEIVILNVSLYLQRRRKEKEEQIALSMGQARVTTFLDTMRSEKDFRRKPPPKRKKKFDI